MKVGIMTVEGLLASKNGVGLTWTGGVGANKDVCFSTMVPVDEVAMKGMAVVVRFEVTLECSGSTEGSGLPVMCTIKHWANELDIRDDRRSSRSCRWRWSSIRSVQH